MEYGDLNPALQRTRVLNTALYGKPPIHSRDHDGPDVALNTGTV